MPKSITEPSSASEAVSRDAFSPDPSDPASFNAIAPVFQPAGLASSAPATSRLAANAVTRRVAVSRVAEAAMVNARPSTSASDENSMRPGPDCRTVASAMVTSLTDPPSGSSNSTLRRSIRRIESSWMASSAWLTLPKTASASFSGSMRPSSLRNPAVQSPADGIAAVTMWASEILALVSRTWPESSGSSRMPKRTRPASAIGLPSAVLRLTSFTCSAMKLDPSSVRRAGPTATLTSTPASFSMPLSASARSRSVPKPDTPMAYTTAAANKTSAAKPATSRARMRNPRPIDA